MDTQNVAQEVSTLQALHELNPSAKRLLLSAHLGLLSKKLRRGICVEAGEIAALMPFTVPDGWQPSNDAPVIDSSDKEWAQRVAEVGALR